MSIHSASQVQRVTADIVDRTESEPALWLFMGAPVSFALTLVVICYLAISSF
jgi:hypothetical protein